MKSNIVYIMKVISDERVYLKIGITNDLEKRLRGVKTGNHKEVTLEHHEEIPKYIKITEMENWLHSVFGLNRESGEWFSDLTVKEVRKKIFRYFLK